MLKRVFLIGVLAVASIFVIACGDDDDDTTGDDVAETTAPADDDGGEGQTIDIVATDFAFDVSDITAAAGEEITINLTNEGAAPHSFTIEDPEAEADAAAGESASDSFTAPDASVEFFCKYHPTQMRGNVTIE